MKKGYKAEWEVKKFLYRKYSPHSVFKIAIGGAVDFLVLEKGGKIKKIVEVKKTNKKRWYPTRREKKQYQTLMKIQRIHKIPVEYWVKIKGEWHTFSLEEVKKFIQVS